MYFHLSCHSLWPLWTCQYRAVYWSSTIWCLALSKTHAFDVDGKLPCLANVTALSSHEWKLLSYSAGFDTAVLIAALFKLLISIFNILSSCSISWWFFSPTLGEHFFFPHPWPITSCSVKSLGESHGFCDDKRRPASPASLSPVAVTCRIRSSRKSAYHTSVRFHSYWQHENLCGDHWITPEAPVLPFRTTTPPVPRRQLPFWLLWSFPDFSL